MKIQQLQQRKYSNLTKNFIKKAHFPMGCKVKELRFGLHKCRTPVPRTKFLKNTRSVTGPKSAEKRSRIGRMKSMPALLSGSSKINNYYNLTESFTLTDLPR